jgi:hypothetical protein
MTLRLYALVGDGDQALVSGMRGAGREPLRLVRGPGIAAVVGASSVATGPVTRPALERHDAIVRRLARRVPALLPARFGSGAADERELRALLRRHRRAVRDALRLVEGREQMTLRVRARQGARGAEATPRPSSGRAYLLARARPLDAFPGLVPAAVCWTPLVRAERGSPPRADGEVLTIYHLIDRGTAAAYRRAVSRARRLVPGLELSESGPFPPYAFAPWL